MSGSVAFFKNGTVYLVLVSVPGSVSLGAPAAMFVSPFLPGSPCSFSASEWAALPYPDPEVVLLSVSDLSSGTLPQPHPVPSFLYLPAPYAVHPPCSLGPLPPVAGTHWQHCTVSPSLDKAHIPPFDPYETSAASRL